MIQVNPCRHLNPRARLVEWPGCSGRQQLETVSREISRLVREGAIEQLDKQGRIYRVWQPDSLAWGR